MDDIKLSNKMCDQLILSVRTKSHLEKKTNREISELMITHVLAHENIFSARYELIEEAIDRLGEVK